MNKLLTIVIPVYKVEPYINKCLDSLLIYKSGEAKDKVLDDELMSLMDILIINDGTPDNSANMSRVYAETYPQYFCQIDKENGGHGSVWNLGVKEAKGKYVKFLDSDDWFSNLDEFLRKLSKTDADLILTSTFCHCENNVIWKSEILDMDFDTTYDADKFDWLGNRSHNYLLHHACCYKTEVFRQYLPLFIEHQPYDDVVLWPAAMIGGKSIEAFDLVLYHYLMDRPGQSISKEVMQKNKWAKIKTDKHTIKFYLAHPVTDTSSTKYAYIQKKMPRLLGGWYLSSLDLPYKEGKQVAKDWDEWLKGIAPSYNGRWAKLYRSMPYWMFRWSYKCYIGLRGLLKHESGPTRYVRVEE